VVSICMEFHGVGLVLAWDFAPWTWALIPCFPCWSRERAACGPRVVSFVYIAYMIPLDAAEPAREFSSSANLRTSNVFHDVAWLC
jgi:hypothetical protein